MVHACQQWAYLPAFGDVAELVADLDVCICPGVACMHPCGFRRSTATLVATIANQEDLMTETTGPVEMLAVSFDATTSFQGRIAEEIEKLEEAGLIRVVDFLFLKKERDSGSLVRVDFEGEGLVTRLMDEGTVGAAGSDALRLTGEDIRSVAAALEPGASAGFMVFEHVWSRGLHDAISEVGGEVFIEGFLAPEVVSAAS